MNTNKLIEFLAKCTARERNLLQEFVQSPYLNKNIALQNLIIYVADNFDNVSIDKETLFKIAYPDEIFQEKRFRYLISNGAKLVTRFWLMEAYESDKNKLLSDQMSIFSKRNIV